MTTQTTLEHVSVLYDIAEYMDDPDLTVALEFIAKLITNPNIPLKIATVEIVRLQAIAAKMAFNATWKVNVDKTERDKKNIYFTAAAEIDKLVQSLKYLTKG